LRVPESGGAPSVTAVAACESAQLFAASAAAFVPGFAIDEQNAGPIAGIVERLGGLPLAARLTVQRTVSGCGGIQVARQRRWALAAQARP
jgi:non-specific serine/threonine protein kinase